MKLKIANLEKKAIAPVIAIETTPTTASVTEANQKRVLIAEDNSNNQLLAEAILTRLGYQTHLVANGLEALEAYKKFQFDLILMDCQMPEMDGYEAAQKIREFEQRTKMHVPIVALTANAGPNDREKCLAAGMDDFVSKPIRRDRLTEVLKQWMKKRPR